MAAPYNVRLDPNEARHFAEHGGTLLLLDVPEGTSFGIDQQVSEKVLRTWLQSCMCACYVASCRF
jgi:hypothetical protein